MASTYPGTLDAFSNPVGTNTLNSPDHAQQHSDVNDAVEAGQAVLGTTAGTSVLKNFAAGDFPARINASNVLQQTIQGTINSSTLGTPTVTGGTFNAVTLGTPSATGGTFNASTIGTPAITGGSATSTVLNTSTIGTPAITGGTATSTVLNTNVIGTPAITGGTATSTVLNSNTMGTPTVTGGTFASPTTTGTDSGTATLTNKTLTSPRIGTAITDTNGNEIIKTPATTSAVNEVTITNSATGNPVKIESTGGDTNIHLTLDAKGSAFTKVKVLRQDITTNSYVGNSVILTGWNFLAPAGGTKRASKSITFGITFSSAPIVIMGMNGYKSSDPTDIGQLADIAGGIGDYSIAHYSHSITTTGFTAAIMNEPSNLTLGWRIGITWIAIGQLN